MLKSICLAATQYVVFKLYYLRTFALSFFVQAFYLDIRPSRSGQDALGKTKSLGTGRAD